MSNEVEFEITFKLRYTVPEDKMKDRYRTGDPEQALADDLFSLEADELNLIAFLSGSDSAMRTAGELSLHDVTIKSISTTGRVVSESRDDGIDPEMVLEYFDEMDKRNSIND